VLEVRKEQKTMSQIASEFGVHVNQLRLWHEIALENWPHAFEPQGQAVEKMRNEFENTIEELYTQVGRLATELTWLKKKRSPIGGCFIAKAHLPSTRRT